MIAVWRETGLSDAEVDALLNGVVHVDHLRIFRNQVIHYQREYDNPKLLKFLGRNDGDAEVVTTWIQRIHTAFGRAIQSAIQANLDAHHGQQ